ncbi:MAG: RNA 2'-phosphotransferase [Cocleimonas sp.]|nr:RNA 2'-phosphotransferase [Cocleimonas sp.]
MNKNWSEKQKIRTGKFISLILRHHPENINLSLDPSGWVSVDQLLRGMQQQGHAITQEQLEELVAGNDKQRYGFNADKTRIRANQGHSVKIDLQLESIKPPDLLYHGTASRFMKAIQQQGLQKLRREHVHLSTDKNTAWNIGSRHGLPIILKIYADVMYQAGFEFYCSDNGVWLTEHIPTSYFSTIPKP